MADSNSSNLPAWGCSICFEESRDPVCTTCGHLFCWPCLYTWTQNTSSGKFCPVCRSSVAGNECIIPVFVATQGEPPRAQAPSTATPPSLPPRPCPRPLPPAAVPTVGAGGGRPRMLGMFRENLRQLCRQNTTSRTRFAIIEEEISQMQHMVDADAGSLATLRQQLTARRRSWNTWGGRRERESSFHQECPD